MKNQFTRKLVFLIIISHITISKDGYSSKTISPFVFTGLEPCYFKISTPKTFWNCDNFPINTNLKYLKETEYCSFATMHDSLGHSFKILVLSSLKNAEGIKTTYFDDMKNHYSSNRNPRVIMRDSNINEIGYLKKSFIDGFHFLG